VSVVRASPRRRGTAKTFQMASVFSVSNARRAPHDGQRPCCLRLRATSLLWPRFSAAQPSGRREPGCRTPGRQRTCPSRIAAGRLGRPTPRSARSMCGGCGTRRSSLVRPRQMPLEVHRQVVRRWGAGAAGRWLTRRAHEVVTSNGLKSSSAYQTPSGLWAPAASVWPPSGDGLAVAAVPAVRRAGLPSGFLLMEDAKKARECGPGVPGRDPELSAPGDRGDRRRRGCVRRRGAGAAAPRRRSRRAAG